MLCSCPYKVHTNTWHARTPGTYSTSCCTFNSAHTFITVWLRSERGRTHEQKIFSQYHFYVLCGSVDVTHALLEKDAGLHIEAYCIWHGMYWDILNLFFWLRAAVVLWVLKHSHRYEEGTLYIAAIIYIRLKRKWRSVQNNVFLSFTEQRSLIILFL